MTVRVTFKFVNYCVMFQGKMYNLNIWPVLHIICGARLCKFLAQNNFKKFSGQKKIKIYEVLMRTEAKYKVGF
jgi:prolipoprotein diacylglyceryltransferase